MTRKDYVMIADAIKRGRAQSLAEGHDVTAVRNVAIEIALKLADDNGRFDCDRFLEACGVNV